MWVNGWMLVLSPHWSRRAVELSFLGPGETFSAMWSCPHPSKLSFLIQPEETTGTSWGLRGNGLCLTCPMQVLGHYRSQHSVWVQPSCWGKCVCGGVVCISWASRRLKKRVLKDLPNRLCPWLPVKCLCLPGACLTQVKWGAPVTGLVLFSQFHWATLWWAQRPGAGVHTHISLKKLSPWTVRFTGVLEMTTHTVAL